MNRWSLFVVANDSQIILLSFVVSRVLSCSQYGIKFVRSSYDILYVVEELSSLYDIESTSLMFSVEFTMLMLYPNYDSLLLLLLLFDGMIF